MDSLKYHLNMSSDHTLHYAQWLKTEEKCYRKLLHLFFPYIQPTMSIKYIECILCSGVKKKNTQKIKACCILR